MCILPSLFFLKYFIPFYFYIFSQGWRRQWRGVAPVDQPAEERPKGAFSDPTPTSSCPPDASQSPPSYSPSVIPLYSSSPTISPVTSSSDIPIKVEYLVDPILVPSPIFRLQGYPSSMSALSSTSPSTSQISTTITNPTITSLPGQDVLHPVPLSRSTPIFGSFSIPSRTLSDPCPSDSLSLDILPPLSSSITYDQDLPSCSFIPSIVILPSVLTLSLSHNTSSSKKSRDGHLIKGKSSRGCSSRGRPAMGRRGNPKILPRPSPYSSSSSCNLSFPQSLSISYQGYLSEEGKLDLSTKPKVCSYLPQNPTINPFFTNCSCSPKIFSPIVSFNEPSEHVFNMFFFTYSCDFFPGQDNRPLLISAIKQ